MKFSFASTIALTLAAVQAQINNPNFDNFGGIIGNVGNGINGIGNGIAGFGNGAGVVGLPGNGGYYSSGLVGTILGSVFGGGYGGVHMGYGNSGLVGGILGSVFGNGCNGGGVVGSVFGGVHGNCGPSFYSLYQTGRSGSSNLNYKVANGVATVEISGMPKNEKAVKGILKIEGKDKAIVKSGQQIRFNPDAQFRMTYM